jgi:hypothetical protein
MALTVTTRIGAMTPDQYPHVLALWQRTAGVGLGDSDTERATGAFLARNPGMSAVAIVGSEIVGAVLCGHDGRRGYLHHLAADASSPRHRRARRRWYRPPGRANAAITSSCSPTPTTRRLLGAQRVGTAYRSSGAPTYGRRPLNARRRRPVVPGGAVTSRNRPPATWPTPARRR